MISKEVLGQFIYKPEPSVFNLSFQIDIYHPILSVLLLYSDTPGVVLKEEQPYIIVYARDNQLKTD